MDCARDAAEVEAAVARLPGVAGARVSVATHVLTIQTHARAVSDGTVEAAVADVGYRLERLDVAPSTGFGEAAHSTTPYRRALWIVVVLNLGFGVAELIGGFVAASQALKADALDFLGDGLITLLGVIAIRWSLAWRARTALLQGLFLGALGTGVLVTTMYRVLVQRQPGAELMGVLAAIALLVNLAAALVLLPHRAGDAGVRAVWLFSRNDAIGNLAVLMAAGLVAVTGTPWPDLVVALVIAGLFLHSSWSIVNDARADLTEAKRRTTV